MSHPLTGQVAELYERYTDLTCAIYDDNLHYGYWPDPSADGPVAEATERMTEQMIRRLDAEAGHTVLDIGCGTGKPAVRLARATGADVTGITVSRRQLDLSNARAQAEGLAGRVRFVYADAMDLPYPDASFDRAWALESMLHMPDRGRVLKETARVLRPGGRLAVADIVLREAVHDPAALATVEAFCAVLTARSLERIDTYPDLVAAAGLELLDVTDVTAQTHRTLEKMLDGFRSVRAHDIGMTEEAFARSLRTFEAVTTMPQIGYALLTARKP
ncbi:27-O-demethylrifamycin SV methyltransferase [Streptomyces capparidis]